jgi:hypothetical protein
MAKLTFVPGKERVVVDPPKINLELSEEEAITLRLILGSVGGCPRESARKHADSINDVLGRFSSRVMNLEVGNKNGNHSLYLDRVGVDMKPRKEK